MLDVLDLLHGLDQVHDVFLDRDFFPFDLNGVLVAAELADPNLDLLLFKLIVNSFLSHLRKFV